MGFGHRVYKNFDPRAKIMQETCHEVLAELGIKDEPLLDMAMEMERIALKDDTSSSASSIRTSISIRASSEGDGLPDQMFTVLFAIARTVGWVSHWKEMIEDPAQRIGRPRQIYTGAGRSATTCRSIGAAERLSGWGAAGRLHQHNARNSALVLGISLTGRFFMHARGKATGLGVLGNFACDVNVHC